MSEGPGCRPDIPGTWAWVRGPAGSTNCPARFGNGSEGPHVQAALPDDSSLGPMARVVDQLSWVTRVRGRGPVVSTNTPRFEGPWVRPAVLGDSGSQVTRVQVPCPAGSTRSPGRLGPVPEAPRRLPDVPGDSGPAPSTCWFEQLSPATRNCVLGRAGFTSCPGRLGAGSEGPRGRQAVSGESGPCPRASRVHQLSQATRARV